MRVSAGRSFEGDTSRTFQPGYIEDTLSKSGRNRRLFHVLEDKTWRKRLEFIKLLRDGRYSMVELCKRFGISRSNG